MKSKSRFKPHHLHFAHGWLWGAIVVVLFLLVYQGFTGGYFHYWLGDDFKIVDAHESIPSSGEEDKLETVMRKTNIKKMVLAGIPKEVLYYNGEKGFSEYEKNNAAILEIQESNPQKFVAFCTLNLHDPSYLETAKACVASGAKGFKLYDGHTFFYDSNLPLNDPSLLPLYKYAEENKLPLIFHVNSGEYQQEFEAILAQFPKLNVACPHFCVSSKNLQRLSYLFDNYPNLYTDISFGSEQLMVEGIQRISQNPNPYQEFITKYADRFLYATDVVVTDYEGKDEQWLTSVYQLYRDLLEKEKISTDLNENLNGIAGLHLDYATLQQIYTSNWDRFMGNNQNGIINNAKAFLLQYL
ncbi:MAG: hypothetical protein UT55_C0049G0004 [Candidatus Peregrinibacteria bacterium GW2011_GWE2_39_6]|nr:MAG: hypothetical protein UT55_C0049G0004 [Candidatus Peregrinibacteria bacterium GW2011_GWE2_39_6]